VNNIRNSLYDILYVLYMTADKDMTVAELYNLIKNNPGIDLIELVSKKYNM